MQGLEGALEMGGDLHVAGAIIALEGEAQARAKGAATLLVTKPR